MAIEIDREHPEYEARKQTWRKYRDLYAGGEQLRQRAQAYLTARAKEPAAVYQERLRLAFYQNYAGSIVDWYGATVFRREPALRVEGAAEETRRFLAEFCEDCDRRGTSLTDFYREAFIDSLVAGESFVLVDFPQGGSAPSRGAEDALGMSRAHLVGLKAEEVINWSTDERGRYEWVVVRTKRLRKPRVEELAWKTETNWWYFDRTSYRHYRHWEGAGEDEIALAGEGRHGLAKLEQVPLYPLRQAPGVWLMNKAASLQLEHFNKANALSWAQTMGLFALPVVYSERDFKQQIGDSFFIQLGPQDRFGWAEPEGHVYQVATESLARLQEEIYRVCFLTQAGGPAAGGQAQSGLSKQRDFTITEQVLRGYGDGVKDHMKRVLRAVIQAREEAAEVSITGLDEFDIGDLRNALEEAERLKNLGIESPTLRREMAKKVAFQYLCDARQEIKDAIGREIDAQYGG